MQHMRLFIVGLLFTFGAVFAVLNLLGGSFIGKIQIVALAAPLALMLLLKMKRYWIMPFIFYGIPTVYLPIPLLDAVSSDVVLTVMIAFLLLAEFAMQKWKLLQQSHWPYRAFLLVGVWITIRFVMAPPGSARAGESGGLGAALPAMMMCWMFFATYRLASIAKKSDIRVWVVAGVILGIYTYFLSIFKSAFFGDYFYYGHLYSGTMWSLMGFALAASLQRRRLNLFYVLVGVTVLFGMISPHRSRIFFALASALMCAYLYKRMRITLLITAVAMPLLVLTLLAVGPSLERAFPQIKRSLSLFHNYGVTHDAVWGELGWGSSWRTDLYRRAFDDIKKHPWVGKGFVVSRQDLIDAVSFRDVESLLQANSSFHNGLFFLANKCGIPITLLWVAAFLACWLRAVQWVRRREGGGDGARFLVAALLTSSVAFLGQMLMNGGAPELQTLTCFCGAMCGLMDSSASREDEPATVPEVVAPVPRRLMISAPS
jgi:hypothetical protein